MKNSSDRSLKNLKACALKYDGGREAPYITSKGRGLTAKKILEAAEKNNIPVVVNPDLLNVLEIQDIGDFIPEETFEVIAKIFAFVKNIESEERK